MIEGKIAKSKQGASSDKKGNGKGVLRMMVKSYIPIIRRDETCKVFIENILMIEQDLRKTVIYTEEDKYWRYGKMDELSKYLDDRFFKCHHSCIINMDKVVKMREQTIFFENGFKITIGREKFQCAKQNFARYMIQEAKEQINKAQSAD